MQTIFQAALLLLGLPHLSLQEYEKIEIPRPLNLDDFYAVGLTTVLDGGDFSVDDVVRDDSAVSEDAGALLDACHCVHQPRHQPPGLFVLSYNELEISKVSV